MLHLRFLLFLVLRPTSILLTLSILSVSGFAYAGSLQLPSVEGLSGSQKAAFDSGFKEFKHFFSVREGLGPVYASNACIACHASAGRGPIIIEKLALVNRATGEPYSESSDHPPNYFPWGQSIRPFFAYPANRGVTKDTGILNPPSTDQTSEVERLVTQRMPPMIFGRGWMEAVAASEILKIEAEQGQRTDGIHGRINWIDLGNGKRSIGRFGLKARLATLEDFTADAYVSDMGITNELRPVGIPNPDGVNDPAAPELPLGKLDDVAAFMRFMKSPNRVASTSLSQNQGQALFKSTQCSVCHAPSFATDPSHGLAKLGLQRVEIYSDLLIHNMGRRFADGIIEEKAGSRDWRTAPLINLKTSKSYLHDGRADTVEAAILAHGDADSEAFNSVEKFKRLSVNERRLLTEFVESL